MTVFSLDFRMLRRTLEMMRYTGAVEGNISASEFGRAIISLRVQQGTIESYLVVTAGGLRITEAERIEEQLLTLGMLDWRIIPFDGTPGKKEEANFPSWAQPMPASSLLPSYKNPIPQATFSPADLVQLSATSYPRSLAAKPERVALWPLAYQQVYNLATGHNSEQDLGRILRYKATDLLMILKDLEQIGVILRGI